MAHTPKSINFYVICYTKARLLIRPLGWPSGQGKSAQISSVQSRRGEAGVIKLLYRSINHTPCRPFNSFNAPAVPFIALNNAFWSARQGLNEFIIQEVLALKRNEK